MLPWPFKFGKPISDSFPIPQTNMRQSWLLCFFTGLRLSLIDRPVLLLWIKFR